VCVCDGVHTHTHTVFVHSASALRLLSRTERFYSLERLVTKALPTILLIVLHTFVWMVGFAVVGMRLFGGVVWDQNAAQNLTDWCTTSQRSMCDKYDTTYNFNSMPMSLISLYVASQKPFFFSNMFYELSGSDSYVYFVLYWLVVPISNLLVLKAVLFQRYWTEMNLVEDLREWYKEKERIYLMALERRNHNHFDVRASTTSLHSIVKRVKSFGSVVHHELLTERYEREIKRIVRATSKKNLSTEEDHHHENNTEHMVQHRRSSSLGSRVRFSNQSSVGEDVVVQVDDDEFQSADSGDDDEEEEEKEEEITTSKSE